MTKDFLSGKKKIFAFILTVILNGLNDTLGLDLSQQTLDSATYIGGGYMAIEGVLDLVRSISNHFLTKAQITNTVQSQVAATVEQSYHGE